MEEHKSLEEIFLFGEKMGNGPEAAFKGVFEKKHYTSGERALSESGVQALLSCVTDLMHLGLLQLVVAGGLRREDIVGVSQKDVNIEECSVSFWEHKKRRIWKVYIPKNVMNTLEMLMNANKKNPYLFPSRRPNKHISSRTAYNIFHKYLAKAGLEKRPFHTLRASCIKLCQRKGWTPEQTAKHVGDTIAMIQEHYATPSDDEMKEASKQKPVL